MRILTCGPPRRPLDLLAVANGRVAAACSLLGACGDVEVWDLASGAVHFTHRREPAFEARSLAFTPDGRLLLASEGDGVRVLDAATGHPRPGPPSKLWCPSFALSAAGDRLLVAEFANRQRRLTLWRLTDGPGYRELWGVGKTSPDFSSPALSPDGSRAAAVERSGFDRPKQSIRIRVASDGGVACEIPLDAADAVQQVAFTADGSRVLARFHGRTVLAFDAATGEKAGTLVHKGKSFVTGLAVHPGGTVLTTRNDGTARFWDAATLRELRAFDWQLGAKLVSAAFSPDGALAATGTEDGRVVVWDADV